MDVVTFQLVIAASILITYLINERWALWVAIGWSIETLILLFYPPLIMIQLAVIWGSYLLLERYNVLNNTIWKHKQRINELTDLVDQPSESVKEIYITIPESKKKVIAGKNHRKILRAALKNAKKELLILSGWVTSYVIDRYFLKLMDEALKRGVRIAIGYGYENSRGDQSSSRPYESAQSSLRALAAKYPDSLIIKEFPNHEKILLKDDDCIVYGSNNWLSNNIFRNSERSIAIYSSELVAQERARLYRVFGIKGKHFSP